MNMTKPEGQLRAVLSRFGQRYCCLLVGQDICEFTRRRDRKKSAGMQGLQRLLATFDQTDPLLVTGPHPEIV